MDKSGNVLRNFNDKPMERKEPPDCTLCRKWLMGFEGGWKYNNRFVFETYLLCKKFNTLPFGGNLINQPAELMDDYSILARLEERIESEKQSAFEGSMKER